MSHILVAFYLEAAFQGDHHAVTGRTPFGHRGHRESSVATVTVDIQFSVFIQKILVIVLARPLHIFYCFWLRYNAYYSCASDDGDDPVLMSS